MENLLCYLSNAEKYSTTGVISVGCCLHRGTNNNIVGTSKCSEEGGGRFLRISVEDEGIGVSEELSAKLFKPFQQTMRLAGGTGLGLYSLAKRMEALRGEYGVTGRSDGKQGSIFWFSIPYQPDNEYVSPLDCSNKSITRMKSLSFEASVMASNSNNADDVNAGGMRALVVEDTKVVAKATRRMLMSAGYQVDCAVNGAVGLEMMKKTHYSFVLMDLQMPVMDGLECVRRFRVFEMEEREKMDKTRPHQTIIGVSANDYEDVKDDILACGMDEFISKPFSIDKLMEYQSKEMLDDLC